MRGVHDLGGLPAGPVDRTEHERSDFEQRVDALSRLLAYPGVAANDCSVCIKAVA